MNASHSSETGQSDQLDGAVLEQPTPMQTVGRLAAIPAHQSDPVDSGVVYTTSRDVAFLQIVSLGLLARAHSVTAAARGWVLPRKR